MSDWTQRGNRALEAQVAAYRHELVRHRIAIIPEEMATTERARDAIRQLQGSVASN